MSNPTRSRKPGGSGKKGKVFLEDKSGLLGLISSITDTKAAVTQARVDKGKARASRAIASDETQALRSTETEKARVKPAGAGAKHEKKGISKSKEKDRALREAKAAIVAADKAKLDAKKRRRKGLTEPPLVEGKKAKKRVGFA